MEEEIKKQPNPWQQRQEIGLFKALFQTAKQVLFSPRDFFNNLEIKKSHYGPVLFYLVVSLINFIISLPAYALTKRDLNIPQANILLVILFLPLILILNLYIITTIVHLGVLLFKGKGGFRATLNVFSYCAATGVFSAVPVIGGLISGIWAVVVNIIGLKRVHNLSTAKAIFAYVLLPVLVAVPFLLAAIAIPNLLRGRITANEAQAAASLKTIATAAETFKTANGKYPSAEEDLTGAKPAYLDTAYNNKIIQGYDYSLNFSDNGYELAAKPVICGSTGTKIIKVNTGAAVSSEECKK